MDAGVGPAGVPAIEIGLSRVELLEAQPLERSLGMADGRLHLAFAVGITDATGQRDDAVVRQHVAVERIERGVVDVEDRAGSERVRREQAAQAARPPGRRLARAADQQRRPGALPGSGRHLHAVERALKNYDHSKL